jgi:hypothetical protein
MLRALGITLLLTCAALSASAAPAAAVSFHSAATPEYLSAQQVETTKFRFPSTRFGELFFEPICSKGDATGKTAASTVESVELVPTYSSCTTQAIAITVSANGCGYVLTPGSLGGEYLAGMKIVCPAGKAIVFRFFQSLEVCEIFLWPQTVFSSNFTLVNEGAPGQVKLKGTAKSLHYSTSPEKLSSNCGVTDQNAQLDLNLAIKGYSDEARTKQVAFRVE